MNEYLIGFSVLEKSRKYEFKSSTILDWDFIENFYLHNFSRLIGGFSKLVRGYNTFVTHYQIISVSFIDVQVLKFLLTHCKLKHVY